MMEIISQKLTKENFKHYGDVISIETYKNINTINDGFTNYKTLMNNPIYDNIKGDDGYYELINKIKDHIDRERIEAGLES